VAACRAVSMIVRTSSTGTSGGRCVQSHRRVRGVAARGDRAGRSERVRHRSDVRRLPTRRAWWRSGRAPLAARVCLVVQNDLDRVGRPPGACSRKVSTTRWSRFRAARCRCGYACRRCDAAAAVTPRPRTCTEQHKPGGRCRMATGEPRAAVRASAGSFRVTAGTSIPISASTVIVIPR
jgi:hypothetical protein